MNNYDTKLEDFKNPFKPLLHSFVSPSSSSIFKNHIRELSEVIIRSDKSLLFRQSSYEEEKKFKLHLKREEVDLRSDHAIFPGTFNQMTFITSDNTVIYVREYRKLLDVIVQIGGFFNGIIYSATIILYIYSNNKILWVCINNVISSKELEERLKNPLPVELKGIFKPEISEIDRINIVDQHKSFKQDKKFDSIENDMRNQNNNNINNNKIKKKNLNSNFENR
jgi:hypothetical protein